MPRRHGPPTRPMLALVLLTACSSKVMQADNAAEILRNRDFDNKVTVQEDAAPSTPATAAPPVEAAQASAPAKRSMRGARGRAKRVPKAAAGTAPAVATLPPRPPSLEDADGFAGRRPLKDPLRVGEKVTLALSYFRVIAGNLELKVKPFAQVNHERAYNLEVTAKTNSFFSHVYAVDDTAATYLSYDKLIPLSLQISIKESKQLAEARTFFDWRALTGDYWQKRITKEHGEQSKAIQWKILDYSQNVISAAFYMRMFKMEPGRTYSFRVADEGKNIVFKGEVLRREKLDTDIGPLDTLVVRPTLTVDGAFAPVGEITFWLTDDDRKFLVRIESKIRIGTLVARVVAIEKGE